MTPADGGTVATTVHDLSPQCLTTIFKWVEALSLALPAAQLWQADQGALRISQSPECLRELTY